MLPPDAADASSCRWILGARRIRMTVLVVVVVLVVVRFAAAAAAGAIAVVHLLLVVLLLLLLHRRATTPTALRGAVFPFFVLFSIPSVHGKEERME